MPMCRAREWNTANCVDSRRDVVSIPGGGRMELIANRRAAVVEGVLMILLSVAAVGFSDEQKKKTTAWRMNTMSLISRNNLIALLIFF